MGNHMNNKLALHYSLATFTLQALLPPPTWTETYDAVNKHVVCPQKEFKQFMPDNLKQEENCLIANMFVPYTEEKNHSVLVYVHGGAFQLGYDDWLKTKYLMKNKDLIVVNFNYRLGIHGFLCLGTEGAPGNAGMKDQVALLRWVQQNIAAFGGNPHDVTIAGYSAGSVSVDLLMISKAAAGLFHKVIPENGANLAAFSVQSDPLQTAKNHAKSLNFTDVDDIYKLEYFYMALPFDALLVDTFTTNADSNFMFSPCIEHDTVDGAFLTESPLSILTKGDYSKVPILYGFANMEGLLRIDLFDLMWKDLMNEKFLYFLPSDLKFETQEEKEKVAKQIKEYYFGDKPISEENILQYVQYFSDTKFVYSSLWAVRLHVEAGHNELYLYEYSFVDNDTPLVPHTNIRGANHCVQTIRSVDGKNLTYSKENYITEEFINMKKIMRAIWHNFIKTG